MLVEWFHWFQHFFNILLINLLFVLLFQIVIAIFKWIVHWDYISFFFNNESHCFFWRLRLILFCVYIFSCYFFFNIIFFLIKKKKSFILTCDCVDIKISRPITCLIHISITTTTAHWWANTIESKWISTFAPTSTIKIIK